MRKMKENACNNKNQKKNPGFLLSAVSSNSGKTAAACGLMSAFKQEGKRVCACKCGPDYIDPMFHREVLGVDSKNLDLFFSEEDILKEGYLKHTKDADTLFKRIPRILLSGRNSTIPFTVATSVIAAPLALITRITGNPCVCATS